VLRSCDLEPVDCLCGRPRLRGAGRRDRWLPEWAIRI